jgi:hypothetical protein
MINKLKGENAHMKSVITDLEKQLEARKKSAVGYGSLDQTIKFQYKVAKL